MRLTKSQLKQLIKEELDATDTLTRAAMQTKTRKDVMDVGQTGKIAPNELAAIDKITDQLRAAAQQKNILSGTLRTKIEQLLDAINQALRTPGEDGAGGE